MSIELKQAAQQVVDAFDAFGEDDDFASLFALAQKMEALRTAIQQAESEPVGARKALERIASWSEHPAMLGVDYGSNGVRDYYRKIARDALTHPAPGVPEFSRIAKRKLTELQEQGFAITGYAIQRGTERGFITDGGFVGWWRSNEALGVPDETINKVCYLATEIRFANSDDAAQAVIDRIRAMLAASPVQKGGE